MDVETMIGNVPLPAKMLRPRLISRRDGWRLLQGRGRQFESASAHDMFYAQKFVIS